MSYGPGGQILPALATSWTIDDKEGGGNEYTFNLRKNVQFHDGAPWNCDAAKLNFDHVLAKPLVGPDYHGWYAMPSYISVWECKDENTFVVTTKDSYYPLLQELSFIRPLRMVKPSSSFSCCHSADIT